MKLQDRIYELAKQAAKQCAEDFEKFDMDAILEIMAGNLISEIKYELTQRERDDIYECIYTIAERELSEVEFGDLFEEERERFLSDNFSKNEDYDTPYSLLMDAIRS